MPPLRASRSAGTSQRFSVGFVGGACSTGDDAAGESDPPLHELALATRIAHVTALVTASAKEKFPTG